MASGLLCPLLKRHPRDVKSSVRTSSASLENMDSKTEAIRSEFSVERHLASPNFELIKTQNLDHSEATHSTPSQKVLRSQPSRGEISQVLKVEKDRPVIKEKILDFIKKEVALLRSVSRKKDDVERQSSSSARNEKCTTEVGQEEDCSKGSRGTELSPNCKEKCDTSASEKHLTEYQDIMLEVDSTSTKNEAEFPVVLTAVSGVTLPEETEKYPRLMVNCSLKEECKSPSLNANRSLYYKDVESDFAFTLKHVEQERDNIGLKPVKGVSLDNVQGVISGNQDANKRKITEDQQQYCCGTCKAATVQSKLNSLTDKVEIHNVRSVALNHCEQPVCSPTSYENLEDNTSYVCLQEDLSTLLCLNKVRKVTPLPRNEDESTFFVTVSKEPKYDGILYAKDLSKLDVNIPNTKQEEVRVAEPPYEEMNEEESPEFQNNIAKGMSSFSFEVSEAQIKQCGHVQGKAKMNTNLNQDLIPRKQMSPKTEILGVEQHWSYSWFGESEDEVKYVSSHKCDSENHLECQMNCSFRLFVSEDEDESEDDEWLVIPLSILDVKWEPAVEDQADPEDSQEDGEHKDTVKQCCMNPVFKDGNRPAPNGASESAFSQMEVFDTPLHQAKAVQVREKTLQSFLVPSSWGITDIKANGSQDEPEAACDTEDSSDYSADSEHNFLTVSRQLLKELSAPASSETDDSITENEPHELKNLQQCQRRRRRRKTSKKGDVIDLDSDTEDEDVQNCANRKMNRLSFTHPQNNEVASLRQLTTPSSETVVSQHGTMIEYFETSGLPSTASPASQRPSSCSNEIIHGGYVFENITASQHIKEIPTQNISNNASVIVISDTDNEGNQGKRQVTKRCIFSSQSTSVSIISCGKQKKDNEVKDSPKTKIKECWVTLVDTKSQHQSKLQPTQVQKQRRDESLSLSHSIKKKKLIKIKVRPEHPKTNRQNISKTVERQAKKGLIKNNAGVVSSETEDSEASFEVQKGLCVSKNSQTSLSSKDSPEILSQSVDREVKSTEVHRTHIQQKANGHMISKPVDKHVESPLIKQKTKARALSSETEDSDDVLSDAQTSSSSEGSSEKQPRSLGGEVDSNKILHEHVQQKPDGHVTSKTLNREVTKNLIKQKVKTSVLSSETEDSDDDLFYAQTSPSSEDFPDMQPQSVDREADSTERPHDRVQQKADGQMTSKTVDRKADNPLITHKRETRVLSSETEDSEYALSDAQSSPSRDVPEKQSQAMASKYDFTLGPKLVIRRLFVLKSSQSSEYLKLLDQPASPARDVHHTAPVPKSTHSSCSPSCLTSSKLQQSNSYTNFSTLNQSCTLRKDSSCSTSTQLSAKERVFSDCQKSAIRTRRDRRGSGLESTKNYSGSLRNAKPGPSYHGRAPRRRHHESEPPLKKRSKY